MSDSTLLVIKYLWPVGVVFGMIVLGFQIHNYASVYDPELHGLGENPSILSLSWDIISGKHYRRSLGAMPASGLIIICLIAGFIVRRIENPKTTGFG